MVEETTESTGMTTSLNSELPPSAVAGGGLQEEREGDNKDDDEDDEEELPERELQHVITMMSSPRHDQLVVKPVRMEDPDEDSDATAEIDSDDESELPTSSSPSSPKRQHQQRHLDDDDNDDDDDETKDMDEDEGDEGTIVPTLETQPFVVTKNTPIDSTKDDDEDSVPEMQQDDKAMKKSSNDESESDDEMEFEDENESPAITERKDQKDDENSPPEDTSPSTFATTKDTIHDDDHDDKEEEVDEENRSPVKSPNSGSLRSSTRIRARQAIIENDMASNSKIQEEKVEPRRSRKAPPKKSSSIPPSTSGRKNQKETNDKDIDDEEGKEGELNLEDLLRSTDFLFVNADKDTVTVADICRALSAEYDCEIPKAMRKLVRERLVDLMKGNVIPEVSGGDHEQADNDDDEEEEEMEEDLVSNQGDVESEHSEFEDSDQEKRQARSKARRAKKAPKKKVAPKRTNDKRTNDDEDDEGAEEADASNDEDDNNHRVLSKRQQQRPTIQRKAAKAARMVEAERRRKQRMEELRVRNEEMQLNQTKEEQDRAEAIAAKFDTNTDEFRLKRLEDRLTLLELLDKKRMAVIENLESKIEQNEASTTQGSSATSPTDGKKDGSEDTEYIDANDKGAEESNDEEEEDSSDDEELDIVGMSTPFKPLKPLHTHLPSKAVSFLKEFRTNQPKKPEPARVSLSLSPSSFIVKSVASPTRKKGARSNLRQALKQKVRKQGNLWLARELGYKTEEDHLKDCQQAADQKRSLVLKMEHARIESNERKLLRERILRQDEAMVGDDDNDEEEREDNSEHDEDNENDEEEDEELQMAKMMETNNSESTTTDTDVFESSSAEVRGADGPPDQNEDSTDIVPDKDNEASIEGEGNNFSETESRLFDTQAPISKEVNRDISDISVSGSVSKDDSDRSLKSNETSHDGQRPNEASMATDSKASNEASQATATGETDAFAEDDEGELEFEEEEETTKEDPNRPRNTAWQAMLRKEAEKIKKLKKNRRQGLVEDQAEEEEEEEVAGLEDFGFSLKKKKKNDDDDDDDMNDDALDEDDLKHVVDDVSDNEGDEEAGDEARKKQERLEEQERHKEILRRMREGYDGRRGGIAGGGVGARGMHRFDQLVAADNREDAKRLGLLNDDELDSDDEGDEKKKEGKGDDDNEEDEAALLDKILKDRFLHRTDVDLEENFSEDEENQEETNDKDAAGNDSEAEEDRIQDRLARRFAKRARMQRLEEEFADSQEFSRQRLIDEDESMRQELSQMKNGLVRNRSISSGARSSSLSSQDSRLVGQKRTIEPLTTGKTLFEKSIGSLSIALRASRKVQSRTSFLGGDKAGKSKDGGSAFIHKSVALSHVVFASANSPNTHSQGPTSSNTAGQKRKHSGPSTSSLFSKVRKAQ